MFPSTNVTSFSKLLGTVAVESNNGLSLKDTEYGVLQEIVKIYSMTRTLHASVIIQSMLHNDCSSVALGGRYDQSKHNPAIYVNPLLFALFVPKFNSIDERMLLSNVAGVVKAKHNKESIATLPDYILFYALVTDKNKFTLTEKYDGEVSTDYYENIKWEDFESVEYVMDKDIKMYIRCLLYTSDAADE